jgi:hypothetical protein
MTVGLSTVNTANSWLNTRRGGGNGVSITAPAALYIELHTADPGASGTTSVAASSTRQAVTFAAASAGAIALSNSPAFTGVSTETITHIAVFDAATVGNFQWSAALTTAKTINSGDTLTFTTVGVSITPLAA